MLSRVTLFCTLCVRVLGYRQDSLVALRAVKTLSQANHLPQLLEEVLDEDEATVPAWQEQRASPAFSVTILQLSADRRRDRNTAQAGAGLADSGSGAMGRSAPEAPRRGSPPYARSRRRSRSVAEP